MDFARTGGDLAPTKYLYITEHEMLLPLEQESFPFWEKDWIAPELKEMVFGQPNKMEKLRTYFIVDTTLRKNITGVFDLDSDLIDVPIKCLLKGEQAEELKEVAPYLIDMTLPDGAWDEEGLVPRFHKDFFKNHLGGNTGIFIRASAIFDDVWDHFQKFPRIQIEEDKRWVYFAFWDCRLAYSYFKSISHMPEKAAQWVDNRNEPLIHSFLGELEHSSSIWIVAPDREKLEGFSSVGPPMLSNVELEGFRLYQIDRYVNGLIRYFKEKDPLHTKAMGDKALKQIIMMGLKRSKQYGLTRKDPVRLYIQFMLGLGAFFDKDPLLAWANEVLQSEEHRDGQEGKANLLREHLLSYLKEVNGKKGEYLIVFSKKMLNKVNNIRDDESSGSTFDFLMSSHPQKTNNLGADILNRLIEDTAQLCKKYKLEQGRSLFILSCMRFTYGAGVIDDPQYSWLGNAVKNDPRKGTKDDVLHKVVLKFVIKVDDFMKEVL